jgi:hypothetical protein
MNPFGYGVPGTVFATPGGTGEVPPMQLPTSLVRVYESCLWSSYRYPQSTPLANRNTDDLYSVPLSGTGQGYSTQLTLAETNLSEAGRVPNGQSFAVGAIAFQPFTVGGAVASTIYPITRADLQNVITNCVLGWVFLNTFLAIGTANLIGAGGGIFGTTADTGAADGGGGSRIALNNGMGGVWIYREFPIMLAAATTFRLRITWGGNAVPVDGGGANAYALGLKSHLIGKFQTAVETA